MKSKITLVMLLIILPVMSFMGNGIFAQTVSGTASNTGCINSGIVTASSTGLGVTPQYQLLKSGVVVSPIAGDPTQFTNANVFTGLSSGTYAINARATAGGAVVSSSNIVVTDGYTAITIATPTKVASCIGGTAALTSTVTAGKAPFTYSIATQAAPGTVLQSSGAITANSFTFNALGVNNYLVSVTDSCGQTTTGATSVSNPTVSINDIKMATISYPGRSGLSCSEAIRLYIERGFVYIASGNFVTTADASLFRWKIKYQGQLYGQDTDGDGYADIGGDGFQLSNINPIMPLIATRNGVIANLAGIRVVLMDMCGGTKEFSVINYNTQYSNITLTNCGGTGILKSTIGAGLDCLPINLTLTNEANAADVHNFTVTNSSQTFSEALTPGAFYKVTYSDGEGYTTGLYNAASNRLLFSATSSFSAIQSIPTSYTVSVNNLDYGYLYLTVVPSQPTDVLSYTVTASSNPLVPVGYTYSAVLSTFVNGTSGVPQLPSPNATDPKPYWPKGNYTLQVNSNCGTAIVNAVVQGRTASLSGYTTTPVCGGFNYVMNGTFDDATAYQVVVVSGPSSVGQVRDLASTTASLPFNGLSYGTYVFGLRIKGGSVNVLTQTITYDANNAIIVDKANTGGFVCAAGATNGVLTITAASNSPAPGNVLEYALSTDGGLNYGSYQSGNTFSGLTDGTYFFKIKDGCGNIITQPAQIGVAAAPDATANGLNNPVVLCKIASGTVQLDVDIFGALSYLWTGPGINASNQGLKNPLINYSDLIVGANNYTCTVTLGPPCNSSTVSNLTINVNALPNIVITDPAAVCTPATVDITTAATIAGSDAGLTYSYYLDDLATVLLANPNAIAASGNYYIKGTNTNGCSSIEQVTVTINELPVATIAYSITPYCNTGSAIVEQTGVVGGTYSSDASLSINASTGDIDLEASSVGDHTITYTFNDANCSNTATTIITINAIPTASVSYPNTSYCNRGTATSVETGVTNGHYTSDSGLSINELTGEIDLANSTVGLHTIEYEFSNGTCSNSTTTTITINATTSPPTLADVTGQCDATAIAPTLTDPCAGTITGVTSTVFPVTTQGTTTVIWTFDYGNGYTQTANQNVVVKDTNGAVMPILADVTAECSATLIAPTATDACTGTITGSTTTLFPITTKGTTVVTWNFSDGNGNFSFANQNVIIADITPPVAPVLADITGQCSITPTVPVTTDNCDSGTISGTTTVYFGHV